MSMKDLTNNAIPFIAMLEQCPHDEAWRRPQTWQSVDDNRCRKDPALTRLFHGPLSIVALQIIALNDAGAGIYISVNSTDLKGRAKRNIESIRAWHLDVDGYSRDVLMHLRDLPLPPSMIARSGGGYHAYWLPPAILGCSDDNARKAMHESELRAICAATEAIGSDRAAADISRVMRLPGTYNQKPGRGVLSTLEVVTPNRYERQEILAAYPPKTPRPYPPSLIPHTGTFTAGPNVIRRAEAYLSKIEGSVSGQFGSNKTFTVALKLFSQFGLDVQAVFDLMATHYNPRCIPPWEEAELMRKVNQAAGRVKYWPRSEANPSTTGLR
jgi:hypothetical protein